MKLGEYQILQVVKLVDFGVYLAEHPNDQTRVLLPKKQAPPDTRVGDELKVFLYKDSKDRLIATTNQPKLTIGSYAALKVLSVGNIGAFLDWGLEKDLFLPYKEMTTQIHPGDPDSPLQKGDTVTGRIYEFSENFGTFAAVDDKYSAMFPSHEDCSMLKIGDVVEAKVINVKPDGKLDLTRREKAYIQMDADAEKVMQTIESYAGVLPFNDKASPEVIKREMKMSKNAFKRAVGRLYKERKIEITENGIRKL